jgi:hypothetical protein
MYRPSLVCYILALIGFAAAVNATSRGSYPRCTRTGRKTGMAHYRGWKVIGNDVSMLDTVNIVKLMEKVSGGLPITPERKCIQTCAKHGARESILEWYWSLG